MTHRSKDFERIFQRATEGLKELLNIPKEYHIFFAASATEIWERSIQNLVATKSHHFVNGSFSQRYYEIARQLGKDSTKQEVAMGEGFDESWSVPEDTELIGVTQNETSTGVATSLKLIHSLREKNPNALIAVDAVSSLPYPDFDYTNVDSVFFSVQKGFGLPAGLGVWMVNEKCIEKANQLQAAGHAIGTYHSLPFYVKNGIKNQTPETPNVLGIYLLANVVEDFLRRGANALRKETEYKAAILYQCLNSHAVLKPFVKKTEWQSKTVVVADCGERTKDVVQFLQPFGLQPGDGYGELKKTQLRFANFPAHSKEQYELLVDSLGKFS